MSHKCMQLNTSYMSSRLEVQIANVKFKKYKWPGRDQIFSELIQAGSETLHRIAFRRSKTGQNDHRMWNISFHLE
jgi:hypothetical protein